MKYLQVDNGLARILVPVIICSEVIGDDTDEIKDESSFLDACRFMSLSVSSTLLMLPMSKPGLNINQ